MQLEIDDSEIYETFFSPVCDLCTRLNLLAKRQCAAFPQGIPLEIWNGDNPHTEAYPGDHGLRFEDARAPVAAAA
jgi:hypothetical protein